MANFLTFDQAVQLFGLTGNKFQKLNGAYVDKGSSTFANLPAPTEEKIGWAYNVTDEFTTDSRFVDGPNRTYSAGTNVMIVKVPGDPVTYKYDVIANYVDEPSLIAPEFDPTQSYSKGDVVICNGKLYVAKDDIEPGEFDPSNFDLTSVTSLISKNEPKVDGEKFIIG
jgi:hypothetical protein